MHCLLFVQGFSKYLLFSDLSHQISCLYYSLYYPLIQADNRDLYFSVYTSAFYFVYVKFYSLRSQKSLFLPYRSPVENYASSGSNEKGFQDLVYFDRFITLFSRLRRQSFCQLEMFRKFCILSLDASLISKTGYFREPLIIYLLKLLH